MLLYYLYSHSLYFSFQILTPFFPHYFYLDGCTLSALLFPMHYNNTPSGLALKLVDFRSSKFEDPRYFLPRKAEKKILQYSRKKKNRFWQGSSSLKNFGWLPIYGGDQHIWSLDLPASAISKFAGHLFAHPISWWQAPCFSSPNHQFESYLQWNFKRPKIHLDRREFPLYLSHFKHMNSFVQG